MENRITIITIREGIAENEAALLWEQLLKLINGFKRDIGEEPLTEEGQQRLRQAMKDGRITFFLALCGDHAVGMCSTATPAYSRISTWNRNSAGRALPICWRRRRRNGAEKTALPA